MMHGDGVTTAKAISLKDNFENLVFGARSPIAVLTAFDH